LALLSSQSIGDAIPELEGTSTLVAEFISRRLCRETKGKSVKTYLLYYI
jgi:hypothetical protein